MFQLHAVFVPALFILFSLLSLLHCIVLFCFLCICVVFGVVLVIVHMRCSAAH